jgi:hypothetical protein
VHPVHGIQVGACAFTTRAWQDSAGISLVVLCSEICLVVILDVARSNAITDFGHRGANQPVKRMACCRLEKATMGTRCPASYFDAASISQIPSTLSPRLVPRRASILIFSCNCYLPYCSGTLWVVGVPC